MKLKNLLVKHLIPMLLIVAMTIPMGTALGKYVASQSGALKLTVKTAETGGYLMKGTEFSAVIPSLTWQSSSVPAFSSYNTETKKILAITGAAMLNWRYPAGQTKEFKVIFGNTDDYKSIVTGAVSASKLLNYYPYLDGAWTTILLSNANQVFYGDVSDKKDGSVRLYVNYGGSEIYILSTKGGSVIANADSSHLFDSWYVKTLDLTNLYLGNVQKADYMFKDCQILQTVYTKSGNELTHASGTGMFSNCWYLKGGNGTQCNGTSNIGATYARIDAAGKPGYFTAKTRMMMFSPAPATEPTVYEPLINQYFQSEAALPAGAVQEEYNLYRLESMPSDFTLREWQGQLSAAADEGFSFYGWRVIYGSGSEVCSHDQLKAFLTPLYEENPSLVLEMKPLYIAE